MTNEQKEKVYEYLRSVALQAHDAIKAVRADNYGEARDLLADVESDTMKAQELLEAES